MKKLILISVLLFTITGCATYPSGETCNFSCESGRKLIGRGPICDSEIIQRSNVSCYNMSTAFGLQKELEKELEKENAILESKKEKCRSYGFKENTDGFGLCMLEQDKIAIQAKREADEQRKREAQALINAGAAILNRNQGNCNFSCPGGQVVQGSCSTSSINVNGKICFKR